MCRPWSCKIDSSPRSFGVLRPGGLLVASDSVASEDLAALHIDDIYNPVDPETLSHRLGTIAFADIEIETNSLGWRCQAHRPR